MEYLQIAKETLITLGAITFLALVAFMAKKGIELLDGKIDAEYLEKIKALVKIAIESAEQKFNFSKAGINKKDYAIDIVRNECPDVSDTLLDSLIESEVFKLNENEKEVK